MHRHKKQSGAGQFGEVQSQDRAQRAAARASELNRCRQGRVIPGVFMPARKRACARLSRAASSPGSGGGPEGHGHDGKTHAVDGKEVAFVTAGRKAVIEAIRAARPIVLEPIVNIEIVVPEDAIGDLTGDLPAAAATSLAPTAAAHGMAAITGEVPLAELNDYRRGSSPSPAAR